MDINKFFYTLLALSIIFVVYKKDTLDIKESDEEKPLVVFDRSVMYDLSVDSIEYIIQSQKAMIFKTHDELQKATLMSRVDKKNSNSTRIDNLTADSIVKYEKDIYLSDNVEFIGNDGLIFKTEDLQYNMESKIAKNNSIFDAVKENHHLTGSNLWYDTQNKKFTASNTHFKIAFKDTNENIN